MHFTRGWVDGWIPGLVTWSPAGDGQTSSHGSIHPHPFVRPFVQPPTTIVNPPRPPDFIGSHPSARPRKHPNALIPRPGAAVQRRPPLDCPWRSSRVPCNEPKGGGNGRFGRAVESKHPVVALRRTYLEHGWTSRQHASPVLLRSEPGGAGTRGMQRTDSAHPSRRDPWLMASLRTASGLSRAPGSPWVKRCPLERCPLERCPLGLVVAPCSRALLAKQCRVCLRGRRRCTDANIGTKQRRNRPGAAAAGPPPPDGGLAA